jgi:hypothetical protein
MSNEEHGSPDPNPVISALNALAHSKDASRLTTLATANADNSATNYLADIATAGGQTCDRQRDLDRELARSGEVRERRPRAVLGVAEDESCVPE